MGKFNVCQLYLHYSELELLAKGFSNLDGTAMSES